MKAVRIILFILIIIGLAALATEKLWVPKLVNHIISPESTTPDVVTPEEHKAQPDLVLKDGRQCYTYSHAATTDAPYKVSEFVDITISGSVVTGTKTGTQSGPDMTNGYSGTLKGTLENNVINDVFAYTVEGSQNKEKEIYHTGKTGIEKLRYPLLEQSGILVPDTTKEFSKMIYARVGCTASN